MRGGHHATPAGLIVAGVSFRRALERAGSGGEPGPAPRSPRGLLELVGHVVVLPGRRCRPVPCAAIGVLVAAEDVGERPMSALALREARVAVERRADERMAKLDVAVEGAHEARRLGWLERIGLDAERGGRVEQGRQTAGVVGRDEQQQHLRRRRQRASTLEIDALDLRALRKRLGQRRAAGELLVAEQARELDQGERIPTGVLHESILHLRRERSGGALGQQCPGRVGVQAREAQLRQPRRLEAPQLAVARGEEQHDPFRLQAPRGERQRIGRRPVQPLGIVDHAHHRNVLRGLREQGEDPDADEEAVLDRHARQPEGPSHRGGLRLGEARQQVDDGPHELVQRSERELGLGLDPHGAQHPHARRVLDRMPEQRRLAEPGIAPDDQRAALRGPSANDEALDSGTVRLSAVEHASDPNLDPTDRRDRPRERTPDRRSVEAWEIAP